MRLYTITTFSNTEQDIQNPFFCIVLILFFLILFKNIKRGYLESFVFRFCYMYSTNIKYKNMSIQLIHISDETWLQKVPIIPIFTRTGESNFILFFFKLDN